MKSRKPPALATWLVEHLNRGDRNKALAGDLLEQFSQGRSVAWYWHQALVAIVAGFVRDRRILAMAAGGTVAWAFPFHYGRFWDGLGERRTWPLAHTYATLHFTSLTMWPLFFTLGIYMAMRAPDILPIGWNVRGTWQRGWQLVWRPLLRGCLAVVLSTFLLLLFLPPFLDGTIAGLLPVFLGLVVMLWSVPTNGARKGSVKFFRIDPPSGW
jgi:hypothetical protein